MPHAGWARRTKTAAIASGLPCDSFAALAAVLIVAAIGCRPPVPSAGVPPADPASLRARLSATTPPVLAARGTLRLEIEGRRFPALNAHLAVRRRGGGSLMLRPGVLAPVLTLWAGERQWSLRLPRERVAFEAGPADEESGEPPAVLSAGMLARIGWYLVSPATLAGDLVDPEVISREQMWILRGRIGDGPRFVRAAEVWIDPVSGGIALWGLLDARGRSLVRVAYDPPFESGQAASRISFSAEPLQARGELLLRALGPADAPSSTCPPLPADWRRLSAEELPDYLESLTGPGE
jgi:hypothetical protein